MTHTETDVSEWEIVV